MRTFTTALVLAFLVAMPSYAEEEFSGFLERYVTDGAFRAARIASGKAQVVCGTEPKASLLLSEAPAPFTTEELTDLGLQERTDEFEEGEIQLVQFRPEGKLALTFTFALRDGRWYFSGFTDQKCE
jgi:hypothetical protein